MDLDAYVAERRGGWNRLGALTAERRPTPGKADEPVLLRERAANHLAAIRSRPPDPVLAAALSRLALGARAVLTDGRRWTDNALLTAQCPASAVLIAPVLHPLR